MQYAHHGRSVGGAHREDTKLVLGALLRRQFGVQDQPFPDAVVVSLGGNALASPAEPRFVLHDATTVTTSIAENVRWLVGAVAVFAAPDARIVL